MRRSSCCLAFLVFLAFRGGSGWLVWLPAALLIGGALGNLADRVRDGAVTDFISLPLWPTFNLADLAIVAGVLLLLFDVERSEAAEEVPVKPEAERLIVHLDEDLAVIEKPAGLVVHSAPSHKGETLVDLLEGIAGGGEGGRPGIVQRLDKDTSGLMLVARNEESHRALARMVKAREVGREYTALVEGHLDSRTGTIDAPLGRHRRQRTKRAVKGAGLAGGANALRGHRDPAGATRSSTRGSRRVEPTRSGSTSRRSDIRWPATRSTGRAAATAWSGSSCMRRGSPSRIRGPARRWSSPRSCRRTSARRWRRPGKAAEVGTSTASG